MPEAARRRVVPEPPLIRAEEPEAAAPKEQWRLSQLAAVAQSEAAASEGDYWPRADLVAARQLAAAPDVAAAEVAAAAPDAAAAEVAAAVPDAAGVVADQAAAAVQVQLEVPAQLR